MSEKFTVGLIQLRCSPDPKENLNRTIAAIRDAAKRGAQIVCLEELFRSQYFCREENHECFDLAEPIPGPTTETLGKIAGELGVVIVASLFERRAKLCYYHNTRCRGARRRRPPGWAFAYRRDAVHSRRSALLRKVLRYTPGDDLGVPKASTIAAPRAHRHADLLGPVVPRRRATGQLTRREHSFLSHGYRLASVGKSRSTAPAQAGRLANHPARARHRQWNFLSPPSIALGFRRPGR